MNSCECYDDVEIPKGMEVDIESGYVYYDNELVGRVNLFGEVIYHCIKDCEVVENYYYDNDWIIDTRGY